MIIVGQMQYYVPNRRITAITNPHFTGNAATLSYLMYSFVASVELRAEFLFVVLLLCLAIPFILPPLIMPFGLFTFPSLLFVICSTVFTLAAIIETVRLVLNALTFSEKILKSDLDASVLCCAAASGNKKCMDLVFKKTHCEWWYHSSLSDQRGFENHGSVLRFSALSGNPEAFRWICNKSKKYRYLYHENCLLLADAAGHNIADYAALSAKPEIMDRVFLDSLHIPQPTGNPWVSPVPTVPGIADVILNNPVTLPMSENPQEANANNGVPVALEGAAGNEDEQAGFVVVPMP